MRVQQPQITVDYLRKTCFSYESPFINTIDGPKMGSRFRKRVMGSKMNKSSLSSKAMLLLLCIYIAISLFLHLRHELWRDEAQAWLLASNSENLRQLVHQMPYEGTPALWHFLLYLLAKFGLPYFSMQVVHFLIVFLAILVFTEKSPFGPRIKVFLPFTYYMLYEYNVISRNYGLSVLLFFLIAAYNEQRFSKPITYSVLVALLANTNVHSFVLSLIIGALYFYETLRGRHRTLQNVVALLLIAGGLGAAFLQLLPPSDISPNLSHWNFNVSIGRFLHVLAGFSRAFIPLPLKPGSFLSSFWDLRISNRVFEYALALFGSGLVCLTSWTLSRRRSRYLYLLSILALFAIFYLKHPGNLRHYGFFIILYIFSLWISTPKIQGLKKGASRRREIGLNLLLIVSTIQIIISFAIALLESRYDFSQGKNVAYFLEKRGLAGSTTLIVTYPSPPALSVLLYLPKDYRGFFSLELLDFYKFIIRNRELYDNSSLSKREILRRLEKTAKMSGASRILFLTTHSMEDSLASDLRLLKEFAPALKGEEEYYLYSVRLPRGY